MIEVKALNKSFKVLKNKESTIESIKSYFKKDYKTIQAVKDLSFMINDGEIVGYLGPNGAGKSTTIKLLTGILQADSGYCMINGMNPIKDRKSYVKEIGVVFGQRTQLWWDIPIIDSFQLLKEIYQIDDKAYMSQLSVLTEILQLETLLDRPARQLSLGQRMRCEIGAALLHRPKILFLDEPTIGLDAPSKIAIRQFIKHMNQTHQTTIILTTHDMSDIEALTSRVMIIGHGQLLYDGSFDQLKNTYPNHHNLDELMVRCYQQLSIEYK